MKNQETIRLEHDLLSNIISDYFLKNYDEEIIFFLKTFYVGKGVYKKVISIPCIMWEKDYDLLPLDYFSIKKSTILENEEVNDLKYITIDDLRKYITDTITILSYPFIIEILKNYGVYDVELYYSFENNKVKLSATGKREIIVANKNSKKRI